MKKIIIFILIALAVIFVLNIGKNNTKPEKVVSRPPATPITPAATTITDDVASKGKILGTYFGPRNFPYSFLNRQEKDINEYFERNGQIGNHVSILYRWDNDENQILKQLTKEMMQRSKDHGFKFFLHFDPLTGMTHAAAAPPPSVQGKSFADLDVRENFKKTVLELAGWKPDILGIGTEVNLMLWEKNQKDFDSYVSLVKEAYDAVKQKFPSQMITISFSWDIMKKQRNFGILQQFKNSLDIYSFTTYPNVLTAPTPATLPDDFYSSIRNYLPTERIGISEISWYSGDTGSEGLQNEFYKELPVLMKDVRPEYITIFFLFDLPSSFTSDEKFSTGGILKINGTPKQSWQVVKDLNFAQ